MISKRLDGEISQKILPFVKWAGGKGQMVSKLLARMPANYNAYHEPFVGAGALFFAVQPKVPSYINDINSQLIHSYIAIRDDVESFIKLIHQMDSGLCDDEHYYLMRSKYNELIEQSINNTETAALFVYINKHCFNGLYRVNSKGKFNVPWNKKVSGSSINENNIRAISKFMNSQKVTITNTDFEQACKKCKRGDFVFFDSPYDVLSKTSGFADYTKESFKDVDHIRLAKLFNSLTQQGVKCMLTNHSTDLINELYRDYNVEMIDVRRAINSDATKRFGKELIITNYEVK